MRNGNEFSFANVAKKKENKRKKKTYDLVA